MNKLTNSFIVYFANTDIDGLENMTHDLHAITASQQHVISLWKDLRLISIVKYTQYVYHIKVTQHGINTIMMNRL